MSESSCGVLRQDQWGKILLGVTLVPCSSKSFTTLHLTSCLHWGKKTWFFFFSNAKHFYIQQNNKYTAQKTTWNRQRIHPLNQVCCSGPLTGIYSHTDTSFTCITLFTRLLSIKIRLSAPTLLPRLPAIHCHVTYWSPAHLIKKLMAKVKILAASQVQISFFFLSSFSHVAITPYYN